MLNRNNLNLLNLHLRRNNSLLKNRAVSLLRPLHHINKGIRTINNNRRLLHRFHLLNLRLVHTNAKFSRTLRRIVTKVTRVLRHKLHFASNLTRHIRQTHRTLSTDDIHVPGQTTLHNRLVSTNCHVPRVKVHFAMIKDHIRHVLLDYTLAFYPVHDDLLDLNRRLDTFNLDKGNSKRQVKVLAGLSRLHNVALHVPIHLDSNLKVNCMLITLVLGHNFRLLHNPHRVNILTCTVASISVMFLGHHVRPIGYHLMFKLQANRKLNRVTSIRARLLNHFTRQVRAHNRVQPPIRLHTKVVHIIRVLLSNLTSLNSSFNYKLNKVQCLLRHNTGILKHLLVNLDNFRVLQMNNDRRNRTDNRNNSSQPTRHTRRNTTSAFNRDANLS